MKNIHQIILSVLLLCSHYLKAQPGTVKVIPPYELEVSNNKTSNLIFPYAVKSVDRGSEQLLAQKARDVENILQVKASARNIVPTNLTVVTSDGKFYSFLVRYVDNPVTLNLSFSNDKAESEQSEMKASFSDGLNEKEFALQAAFVAAAPPFFNIKTKDKGIILGLDAIHVAGDVLWITLHVNNRSLIDLDVSGVRFFVSDKKRARRTAVQDVELMPIYRRGDVLLKGKKSCRLYFAFHPFVIDKSKKLQIQVSDEDSGHHLRLQIGHRKLLKAKRLIDKGSI